MHVKNAITTFPKMERVNQKSVQLEIHTLLTLTENIANRITVMDVKRGCIKERSQNHIQKDNEGTIYEKY